jgi:predicted lipoprotein with Yx(FWY)xxD motif
MNISTVRSAGLAAAAIGALAIAGCSSSSKGSGGSQAAAQNGGGTTAKTTVALRNVSGTGDVLVDGKGRTLYMSDQEMSSKGKILCSTGDCTAIWTPLTVAAGQKPTAPSSVMSMLATVKRPDGTSQVSFGGAPLYTFSFDHKAGDVGGNGEKDSFAGTDFTWHAATANGAATAPSTPPSSSDTGYGNGGY